jgi:hypothetical protein
VEADDKGVNSKGPEFEYQGGMIRLDKEGRWYHEGVEITHKLTADLFSRSVEKDPAGGYRLVVGPEWSPIEVEDTPFMVRRVEIEADRAVIRLNDGTEEELEAATLRVGGENVLYCKVKNGEFPARFLRPAYYQLMQALEETKNGYAVKIGNKLYSIKTKEEG